MTCLLIITQGAFLVITNLNFQYQSQFLQETNTDTLPYTLNMDISFGNGNSILKLLRGVSHSQLEFGVGIQSK